MTYILNRLQREAAGKIKLGLDLQGGMSFLLEMDTNRLASIETVTNSTTGKIEMVTNQVAELQGALSQAIDVLRRRVDKFGVAEPIIQPEGNNRILVQLPGLSEAAQASAIETIEKPAYLEFRLVYYPANEADSLIKEGMITP